MENHTQYELLKNDPNRLLSSEAYQDSIKKVVYHFVKKGWIKRESVDDYIQDINRDFIERQLENIKKNYQPEIGSLMSYFIQSVYNKCRDLIRKHSQYNNREISTENPRDLYNNHQSFEPESQLIEQEIIEQELHRLKIYLAITPRIQGRVELFLKIYSRCYLTEEDIQHYCRAYTYQVPFKMVKSILKVFANDYSKLPNNQVFEKIRPLVQSCEKKEIQTNGLVKWLNRYIDQMLEALNENSYFLYDKESLKNLLRIYYKN